MIIGSSNTQFESCGILREHYKAFLKVTENTGVVIGLRSVSPFAYGLLEYGCPTKPFVLKAKSSQMGIAAGCIVIDPRYSHIEHSGYDKHNKYIRTALENNSHLKVIDLVLPKERITQLAKLIKNNFDIWEIKRFIKKSEFNFEWKNSSGDTMRVVAKRNAEGNFIILDENNSPIQVVGGLVFDKNNNKFFKPITADYDLLMTCIPYKDFEPGNQDKNPTNVQRKNSGSIEDPNGGNWSPRTQRIVTLINNEITAVDHNHSTMRKNMIGLEVVHHNAEFGNPFADKLENNFPCTFIFPKAIDLIALKAIIKNLPENSDSFEKFYAKMVLVETIDELVSLRDVLYKNGYYFPTNVNHDGRISPLNNDYSYIVKTLEGLVQSRSSTPTPSESPTEMYFASQTSHMLFGSLQNQVIKEETLKYRSSPGDPPSFTNTPIGSLPATPIPIARRIIPKNLFKP